MSTHRPTVAIFEKDYPTSEMYRRELAQQYDVFPCANINDARLLLEQREINIIILEPVEFGDNVWGFFHEVMDEKRSTKTLVILCSTVELRNMEMKKKLAACLVKPVLPTELSLTVQRVLENILKK